MQSEMCWLETLALEVNSRVVINKVKVFIKDLHLVAFRVVEEVVETLEEGLKAVVATIMGDLDPITGGMQGGGRDEQQKKVDQKEKGEKNVDCCHDKEDCPRQGRDSKSVDLVRNIQALTKRSVGGYHANFLQILYLAIHQVVSYQNVLFT